MSQNHQYSYADRNLEPRVGEPVRRDKPHWANGFLVECTTTDPSPYRWVSLEL